MKSHMIARFEGACAHLPLRARDGVDLVGVRSGSGKSLGCPRVDTMLNSIIWLCVECDNKYLTRVVPRSTWLMCT